MLNTWVVDAQTWLRAAVEPRGFSVVRYAFEMLRDLSEPIPEFALPAGFEIRPATHEQRQLIWDADHRAFADHWGYAPPTEALFQRWLTDPENDPALWKVAWHIETNQIAAQVLNYVDAEANAKFNRKRGMTEDISTQREFRKRGLARALICESLRMFRDKGFTEAGLGVDAENLTGALHVYEACGFKRHRTELTYQKSL